MTRQPAITSRFAGQRFPVGSIVAFRDRRGRSIRGKVAELRPQDALVAAGDHGRYRVPYTALRLITPGPRGGATLAEIEALAADLLRTHELASGLGPGWRFHFETTANRAGVCHHRTKTIAMAVSATRCAPAGATFGTPSSTRSPTPSWGRPTTTTASGRRRPARSAARPSAAPPSRTAPAGGSPAARLAAAPGSGTA